MQIDACGLQNEVERSLHQSSDRRRRPLRGEAADHDRPRSEPPLPEGAEHLDAVPPRHLHIERDHVGLRPRDEFHRGVAVRSGPDNLDARDPPQHRQEHLPVAVSYTHLTLPTIYSV